MTEKPNQILCIDDDPYILKVTAGSLEIVGGMEVALSESGEEGLELAHRIKPDLILVDVMMPNMNGLAVLKRILADVDLCKIPVVLMTARTREKEVEQYLSEGATAVISKPFDPMTLPAELTAIWQRAGMAAH